MKSQEQLLKEIKQFTDRNLVLSKQINIESKNLPDFHSIGRLMNAIDEMKENLNKIQTLQSVLI